jgi:hypothetical protein
VRKRTVFGVVVALVALTIVPGSGASNRGTFVDDTGDHQGAGTASYAADIRSVEIVTDDLGSITFRVGLANNPPRLVTGDTVRVQVDSDQNLSSGIGGYELELRAMGTASPNPPNFEFCVVDRRLNIWTCQPGTQGNYSQEETGTGTLALSFRFNHPWRIFNFRVVTEYSGLFDVAPNAGHFTYETRADPDGDGIYGTGDKCPTRSAKPFDSDFDGCAGPYKRLPAPGVEWRARVTGGGLVFVSFRVINAPSGTRVTVRGGGTSATRRGNGSVGRMVNRYVRAGSTIAISFRRPGRCTSTRTVRVVRTGGGYTLRPTRVVYASPTRGGRCT